MNHTTRITIAATRQVGTMLAFAVVLIAAMNLANYAVAVIDAKLDEF